FAKNLRCAENRRAERGAESALDPRNDLVPEHVSGVRDAGVRTIVAVRNVPFGYEGSDLISHDPKHRPDNFQSMGLSHQLHPCESSCSASAQKIEEARFDLVISMVAEKDPLTSMVSCTASEE